ncbi:hypothetical protein A2899_03215 [Candidatus Amesbacteria bacterium RIFCSPLOWO2_01_FULL_49_25]|uniref:DNA-(apurinic or apyrimidinic site) lyase n=1 Tax=Candidatus Amesbacteria bacterium RIFCSPHIGHO2_01_FULL_48_32b TaxID=1797253 RepID=A0A1F4YCM5_9BACT|nr:MAG: hypothetical protein A2876_04460 [Candidatus Amesbacteria bacterium RIFCSPHIGHO2_01_FULL_48_32b]OGD07258.1 MAG: hypothetical protein A2899_03215 [Candidatus Amesbacteria bacterium RIFCSPLOWO2_01_FULL_49_25]
MKVNKVAVVDITPATPFDFDSTFHKPDHFTSGDNHWEPGGRWQTWLCNRVPLGLKFVNSGSREKPRVKVEIWSKDRLDKGTLDSLISEIRYRYNLDLDLSDFYKQFGSDKILGPTLKKWRGMRPGHPSSLYEYLIIGIALQNATVRRSIQMFRTLLEKYGTQVEFDGQKLWCFWEPGRLIKVTEQELRDLKVGYRAKSIKKIDDYFATGAVDEMALRQKNRETQMGELLKLYGVGPATVWYLLFDVFHHLGFFNHVSPWEQKIYSKVFFDRDPEKPVSVKKLLKHFEKFGDYKQLAVHYIWEDLWWTRLHSLSAKADSGQERRNEHIPWLEKLIRI